MGDSTSQASNFRHQSWRQKLWRAIRGLGLAVTSHDSWYRSSWLVHVLAAVGTVVAGATCQIERWEWGVLLAAISIVVLSELINTSIEHVSRAVTTEYDQNIETALDIAAGFVLFASAAAILAGALIFGPRFWLMLQSTQ